MSLPRSPLGSLAARVRGRLPMPLTYRVPIVHEEAPEVVRRRRRVVVATSVAGAGLLGLGLSARPGSRQFYASTTATAVLYAAGGIGSGPLHLGWVQLQDQTIERPVLIPLATGVGAFGFFYGCALVAKRIPVLSDAIASVLQYAEQGNGPAVLATTVANGLAEEVFFRGAVYAALGDRHPIAASTGVYALSTVTTRNPALVLAAGVMGTLFAAQRRATNGLQAPVLTHLAWSGLMLRYLPPLFRDHEPRPPRGPAWASPTRV